VRFPPQRYGPLACCCTEQWVCFIGWPTCCFSLSPLLHCVVAISGWIILEVLPIMVCSSLMLLFFGFLGSCLSARMIFLYSREPVPFDFRLYKGVCSLYFLFLQACLALVVQGVCSLSFSIQQACLAYSLYKGVCSLCLLFSKLVLLLIWSRDFVPFSLYCWSPASF
jgi:hypothetical protein